MTPSSRASSTRGTLDLLVLGVLEDGPLHGYAIARRVEERSGDELQIEEGSLYPALYRMEEQGWLRASWGRNDNNRRVRVYALTAAGARHLADERVAWDRFAAAVRRVAGV